MSASLDRPAPVYMEPGPDQQPMTADECVDQLLAIVGRDSTIDQGETRAVQRLMAGLQAIAMQRAGAAMPAEDGPSDETSDFGATDGTEGTDGSQPMPGQEWAGQGY